MTACTLFVAASLLALNACASQPRSEQSVAAKLVAAQRDYETGKFARAEDALEAILKKSPDDTQALATLALAHAAQGKNGEAIREYGELIKLQPKDHASWYRLALLERLVGKMADAEVHLEKALSLNPGDRSYTDELARTKMLLGKYAEAEDLWGSLLDDEGIAKESKKQLLVLQGQAFQADKDYTHAKKAFEAALELDPSDEALMATVASFE